ncbi:hypothetical protein L6R52_14415 [Myxococcota bacterium]|nr:hypothetical protein [Myxococcota bacterium]
MADDRGKKKGEKNEPKSPWLAGVTGVTGVVPPGRRLSPIGERRPTRWSASGVRGVTPPGKQKPGEGPAAETAAKLERKQTLRDKAAKKALEQAKASAKPSATAKPGGPKPPAALGRGGAKAPAAFRDPGRPTAGFVPDAFGSLRDPDDLKAYLELISEFFKASPPGPHAGDNLGELILQSHAPFELVVAFTALSAIVGKSASLRKRHTAPLERGAKAFFNLARRLNPNVKAPRGLVPETLDAIFYDLPQTAYQVPYAFATDALCRLLELFRAGDEDSDRELVHFAEGLRARFIDDRSLGDQPLSRMFPWQLPDWAPEEDPGLYGG